MKKIDQSGIAHVGLILLVVVLAGVGFVGWRVYDNGQSKPVNSVSEQEDETTFAESLDGILTLDKVSEIVLNEKPDVTISDIELEQEDQGLVYKVTLTDGTELFYDATTGAKVAVSDDDADDDVPVSKNGIPKNADAKITVADAVATANAEMPGKTIKKVQIEMEHGKLTFSVRFTDGSRVDVDAVTGEIVRTKKPSGKSSSKESSSNSGSGSSSSGHNDDGDDDDAQEDANDDHGDDNDQDEAEDESDDDSGGHNRGSNSGHDNNEEDD